jgi:hypothetical protein
MLTASAKNFTENLLSRKNKKWSLYSTYFIAVVKNPFD